MNFNMFCEEYVNYLKEYKIENSSGQDNNMSAKEDIFKFTIKTIKTFPDLHVIEVIHI